MHTYMQTWRTHICKLGLHICKYTLTHICIHTHTHKHTYVWCIPMRTQLSVRSHSVFRAYIHICVYLHTHIKHTCKQDTSTDMYFCICIHTLYIYTRCLFMHICIDVHTYTHVQTQICIHIFVCTHISSVCTHSVLSHTYMHTYIYQYTHVQKQKCMHAFIRTCIYM